MTWPLTERFVHYLTYENAAPLREDYDLEAVVKESSAIRRTINRAIRIARVSPRRCCRCEAEQSKRYAEWLNEEEDGLIFCSEKCRKSFALAEIRCCALEAAIKRAVRRLRKIERAKHQEVPA